ncbi:MAG: haloacid dehalogenase-like hydrolase, partial [Chloroflexi bacterium]|nr:haloacid dehalogenase-like hydrolase [Chloroflexota bacterium]
MHRAAPRHFVLVDFDGTLCAADVGNQFFRRFARDAEAWRRLIADWKSDRISARECLARECELAAVGPAEADRFFDGFELAPDAVAFATAAAAAGVALSVASDGLERYVERLLRRAGLELPASANELVFAEAGPLPRFASVGPDVRLADGRIATARAGAGPGCGRCGNCKGALLE